MKNYQIFMSYRRDGGDVLAGRLTDRFTALGYTVFFDVESMRSGPFNKQLLRAIDQCDDFVLVLPPNGLDRCVNDDDWVRQELAYALTKQKNIIPVIMRGFEFPRSLPSDIDSVRYMEGVVASHEYFDAVIDRMERMLLSNPCNAGVRHSKTDAPTAEDKFDALLHDLFQVTVRFRDALRKADAVQIDKSTADLQKLITALHSICEQTRYSHPDISQSAAGMVEKFNCFAECYNAFASSSDRMSKEAQTYAQQAEELFLEFVDSITKCLR